LVLLLVLFIFAIFAGGVMDRLYGLPFFNKLVHSEPSRFWSIVEERSLKTNRSNSGSGECGTVVVQLVLVNTGCLWCFW
jgi:hypothetical protein